MQVSEGPVRANIDKQELIQAVADIMNFCQEKNMSEMLAYAAMTSLCKTMEDLLGFSHKEKADH